MLRGEKEFAAKSKLGGAAVEGFFGGNSRGMRIVVFLGEMCENEVASPSIEASSAVGVDQIFTDRVIGEMTVLAQDTLLDDPWIRTRFEHVRIVVRFQDHAIRIAEMDFDMIGHIAEIGDQSHLYAIGAKGEANGIGGIVWNTEGVHVNIADGEVLPRVNGFYAIDAFAKSFGKNALHRAHRGFGDVERCLPQAKHLRQAVAMVRVFVGDEDAVDVVDGSFDGGEAGERFALAEPSVHEESGALRLE